MFESARYPLSEEVLRRIGSRAVQSGTFYFMKSRFLAIVELLALIAVIAVGVAGAVWAAISIAEVM